MKFDEVIRRLKVISEEDAEDYTIKVTKTTLNGKTQYFKIGVKEMRCEDD